MKSFPFPIRCSLVAVLLPPMIFLFVILGIVSSGMPDVAKICRFYGISVMNWLILLFGVLPILMMLLIFFKGYWRLALILLFTEIGRAHV